MSNTEAPSASGISDRIKKRVDAVGALFLKEFPGSTLVLAVADGQGSAAYYIPQDAPVHIDLCAKSLALALGRNAASKHAALEGEKGWVSFRWFTTTLNVVASCSIKVIQLTCTGMTVVGHREGDGAIRVARFEVRLRVRFLLLSSPS